MNSRMPDLIRKIITITILAGGSVILLAILNPTLFVVIINIVWTLVFTIASIFVIVGVLTVIGRKQEASKVIDLMIEGSVTAIDLIEFIRLLIHTFVEILKKALLIAVPYTAYFIAALIYLVIIIFYKDFGRTQDVALITIVVTGFVTIIAGLLNKPKNHELNAKQLKSQLFVAKIRKSFSRHFIDAFEVSIFVLFLTVDSTNLIFLPKELNTHLVAEIGNFDLMIRGYSTYQMTTTIKLIMIGLVLEFLRNAMRLIAEAAHYYRHQDIYLKSVMNTTKSELLKALIRLTISQAKDEIMRFTAFTTFMMIVFLIFPRLKLVALITGSATNLLLDLLMPQRLTFRKSDDLINRTFNKVFKLEQNPDIMQRSAWN